MVCDEILSLAAAIRSSRNTLLQQFGLSQSQYELLHVLSQYPEHACTVTWLADQLGWISPSASATAAKLAATGWLEKRGDPRNRRIVLLCIAAEKVATFQAVERAIIEHDAPWREQLPLILAELQAFLRHDEAEETLFSAAAAPRPAHSPQ